MVRAYKDIDEVAAFWDLLEHEVTGKGIQPKNGNEDSYHQVPLSCAEWLLKVLGSSSSKRQLHPDDSPGLHEMHNEYQSAYNSRDSSVCLMIALLKKEITWTNFVRDGKVNEGLIKEMMGRVRDKADILCSTPSIGCSEPLREWREWKTRGIAVDEAANMTRPDLYSVWGNVLLPCALGGDGRQFPPFIMTGDEPWELDKGGDILSHRNRFTPDGLISPLEFLRGSGIPVYRLRTQLRMATGLFQLCHDNVYNDDIQNVPYGPKSDISIAVHDIGRALEAYTVEKYGSKGFKAAEAGTLQPMFINCPNPAAQENETRTEQSRAALDFIKDFVETKKVDPGRIAIIVPYKADVDPIERLRTFYPTLAAIPRVATVDSFQGQERPLCRPPRHTAERRTRLYDRQPPQRCFEPSEERPSRRG